MKHIYLFTLILFVFIGVAMPRNNVSAVTYYGGIDGDIESDVNTDYSSYAPSGQIRATGTVTSVSSSSVSITLSAITNGQNKNLIPQSITPAFGWDYFTAPSSGGVYYVTFTTGVDEPVGGGGGGGNNQPQYYSNCFIADTKVTLADGTVKNIQDVKIGDVLKGEKTNNTVLAFHRPTLDGQIYSFNGGRYFVTAEHPFKTTEGWKAIDSKKTMTENIGITVTDLKVGDTLVTDHGKVVLNSIQGKNESKNTPLFNFILTGDHTYYADGYLVHNKSLCDQNNFCGLGVSCIDPAGYPITPPPSGTCAIGCVLNGHPFPYCHNPVTNFAYCPNAQGQCI